MISRVTRNLRLSNGRKIGSFFMKKNFSAESQESDGVQEEAQRESKIMDLSHTIPNFKRVFRMGWFLSALQLPISLQLFNTDHPVWGGLFLGIGIVNTYSNFSRNFQKIQNIFKIFRKIFNLFSFLFLLFLT